MKKEPQSRRRNLAVKMKYVLDSFALACIRTPVPGNGTTEASGKIEAGTEKTTQKCKADLG